MDKELLSYLADLATVRTHINSILNVGRGVIDQKTLHQMSARTATLDQLFVRVLVSGQIPGQSTSSVNVNNDDYVDISKRVREEKAKLIGGVPEPVKQAKTPAQLALEEDEEEEEDIPTVEALSSSFDIDDDMAAVAALISKAEKSKAEKSQKKKGRKKSS
jgi:hypothetical protein